MRIYVIEDDVNQAMSTRLALEKMASDLEVCYSMSADDAVRLLLPEGGPPLDWKPDLIFLDINMPGIDGVEMLRRLKQDDRTKDIPAIMFTATKDPQIETTCVELGAADFIMKPADWREYHQALEEVVMQHAY